MRGNARGRVCVELDTLGVEAAMRDVRVCCAGAAFMVLAAGAPGRCQSSSGPMTPVPGTPVQQAPPGPKIGVRVTLVNTPAVVRDSKDRMIETLDAKDFHVTDNGVQQEITHFDLGGDPISLVVLVETSSRIGTLLPEVRKAGILVTENVMGARGEAAVIGFNDSVDKLQGFTASHDKVQDCIAKLPQGTSGSKLYDAMAIGVEMLSGQPLAGVDAAGRRRVMLMVSEGVDEGSAARFGEVLGQAQLANITIYSVGLSTTRAELTAPPRDTTANRGTPPGVFGMPPQPGTVQTPETEANRYGRGDLLGAVAWAVQHAKDVVHDNPLQLAAAGTGGAALATWKNRSIDNAIDDIGAELHAQYSLTYIPTGVNETGYHEIKVSVAKNGLKVRARPGYYVTSPGN
jgi:VWFA-related protein